MIIILSSKIRYSCRGSASTLPIIPGRPSIVLALKNMRWHILARKNLHISVEVLVLALPIFPGSHPPSIVGANELNFCVRYGNRWTLIAINTNSLRWLQPSSILKVLRTLNPNLNYITQTLSCQAVPLVTRGRIELPLPA